MPLLLSAVISAVAYWRLHDDHPALGVLLIVGFVVVALSHWQVLAYARRDRANAVRNVDVWMSRTFAPLAVVSLVFSLVMLIYSFF